MVRHFDSKPSAGQVRDLCTFEIVMTINPFSFMSGVWSYECRLFMEEKVEILKAKIDNLQSLNNENLDIYGPCRNRAKFRMYLFIGELCEIKKNSSKYKKTKSWCCVTIQARSVKILVECYEPSFLSWSG